MIRLTWLAGACLLLPATAAMAQTADACEKLKIENAKLKFENANLKKQLGAGSSTAEAPAQPLQKQTVQQVSYALVKCQGNSRAQTVTVTLLLTNAAANRSVQFESVKATDAQGEEYKTFDVHIGAEGIRGALATGVPVKATFVIPKVLPSVKLFKLLACPVYDENQPGRSIAVEFRDVTVAWQ